jgi:hypothetical protein
MFSKIVAWSIRFAVHAAIFLAVVMIWLNRTTGWASLNLLGASIAFGVVAAIAWCLAIAVEQRISNVTIRLAVHPVLMLLLFTAIAYLIIGVFYGTLFEFFWRDVRSFLVLVTGAAAADALAGYLIACGTSRRSRPTG